MNNISSNRISAWIELPTVKAGEKVQLKFLHETQTIVAQVFNSNGKVELIKPENLPKECKEIRSSQQLQAFVRDAFARVQRIDDIEPKLYIQQRGAGGIRVNQDWLVDSATDINLPQEIMELINAGEVEMNKLRIKANVVCLVGRTGAGKSVLGNLLCGVQVQGIKDAMSRYRFEAVNPRFSVGRSVSESCTVCPGAHTSTGKDFTVVDLSGFDDTHGGARDIANAFFRSEVFKNAHNIKVVLPIHYNDISGPNTNVIETLNNLLQLFGYAETADVQKLTSFFDSITLVVTHVPATSEVPDEIVRTTLEEFLTSYAVSLADHSGNASALLNYVLAEGRWDFFSQPFAERAAKPQIEVRRIEKLINSSAYFDKSETTIAFNVSNKYAGRIQSAIVSLIRDLKRDYNKKILAEIESCLKASYADSQSEEDIKNLQSQFQKLTTATTSKSLFSFIKPFDLRAEFLDEIKKMDDILQFLTRLLPQNEVQKYPYERNWIAELGLQEALNQFNTQLLAIIAPAVVTQVNTKLTIAGYFPKTSELAKELKKRSGITEIEIYGLQTVLIDEDLPPEKTHGVHVTVIAPKWEVRNERTFNLTGEKPTGTYTVRAPDGQVEGESGKPGNPGYPGGDGGVFYGFGAEFKNISGLTVFAKGASGGKGQTGGNGMSGIGGKDAYKEMRFDLIAERKSTGRCGGLPAMSIIDGYVLTDNNHWQFIGEVGGDGYRWLKNLGSPGQKGGDAGAGGAGGLGGRTGTVKLFPVVAEALLTAVVGDGETGSDGNAGVAGIGGLNGRSWSGRWHAKKGWNGESPKFSEESVRAASGNAATAVNTTNRPSQPAQRSYDVQAHLYQYRIYMAQAANALTAESLEKFRKECDTNQAVKATESFDNFMTECKVMEDFFLSLSDKSRALPLYQAMAERLLAHEGTVAPKDLAMLQSLYAFTLSRIGHLNAYKGSRLIIDLKGFIKRSMRSIEALDRLDHIVQVAAYRDEYVGEINGKIKEADLFLGKLRDDIKAADDEIDKQIATLVAEITTLKSAGASKITELQAKREELKASILKRKILGGLSIVAQCVGACFPPAGPIVAGIAGAAMNICANPKAAATIGATALTTYADGLSQIIDGKNITIGDVSTAALTRVRGASIAASALNIASAVEAEDQVEALNKAISDIKTQQGLLDQFKTTVQGTFNDSLHRLVDDALAIQSQLKDKSKIALDYNRLAVKRSFAQVQQTIKSTTSAFKSGDGFSLIIEQMLESINATSDIYERIEEYREKRMLAEYIAKMAAPTATDPRIESYKQKVQRNIVLEHYSRAVAAVKQWAFPFADDFLGNFAVLKTFAEQYTVTDFMTHVVASMESLRDKVDIYHTEINSLRDQITWVGDFNAESPNGPFFVWDATRNPLQIRDLLLGKRVVLFANVAHTSDRLTAVKFNQVELQFKYKGGIMPKSIAEALSGVMVEMTHCGTSYFKHDNKLYSMTNDSGFALKYHYGRSGNENVVYTKMRNGDFMLSPYTYWAVKVDVPADFLKKNPKMVNMLEVHLKGRGQFVRPEGKN